MKYVIANLKMNLVTKSDCDRYLDALVQCCRESQAKKNFSAIVCPSDIYLERFSARIPLGIMLGAQDVFWETKGSYTGEVSPLSLKEVGVRAVLCGHSERRLYYGETNAMVARKVKSVMDNGMMVILCIGETADERAYNDMAAILAEQIASATESVSADQLDRFVIAYEPRWSIGSDMVPTTREIMEVRILIRKVLTEKYGRDAADKVAVLYGGSVKSELMNQVCLDADMDGVLIGREGLDPSELLKIANLLGTSSEQ